MLAREQIGDESFIISSQSTVGVAERNALKAYVQDMAQKVGGDIYDGDMQWRNAQIEGVDCLFQLSNHQGEVYAGAYVNMARLLSRFATPEGGEGQLLCLPTDALETLAADSGMLVVSCASAVAPFSLVELLPESAILDAIPFMQRYILLISILLVLIVPLLIWLMRRIVVEPLSRLTRAMHAVEAGDLTYRIEPRRTSNEFAIVNETFNHMTGQVQALKIDVYEEKLSTQRAQLRNLQLQVRPHFIINSLNMVNNLIENGEYDTARGMIRSSVDYFRYMVKVDQDMVPLCEELQHVRNYLDIQSVRYGDRISFDIEVDQRVSDMLVPPVLVQGFVENSVKYAVQMSATVHIAIRVESFEVDFYPFARIIVSDTGPGYPQAHLEALNQGVRIQDGEDGHIGIYNTIQRLSILFGSQVSWRFYNDGGAVSELCVPAIFADEE